MERKRPIPVTTVIYLEELCPTLCAVVREMMSGRAHPLMQKLLDDRKKARARRKL
jgi:hypothetical protein